MRHAHGRLGIRRHATSDFPADFPGGVVTMNSTVEFENLGTNELAGWWTASCFDERERAAFAWTEPVTQLQSGVPDAIYESVRSHFDEAQLVDLTYAIVAINGWNRLLIAFRGPP